MFLSNSEFLDIIKNTNLFAFDLIINDSNNKILLAKRENEPAKDFFFVPGGRVFKNENLNIAFERILKTEVNISKNDISNVQFLGLYNHLYENNTFNNKSNTHYIVFTVIISIKENVVINLDTQHSEYMFLPVKELIASTQVHQYVKNYFIDNSDNQFLMDIYCDK